MNYDADIVQEARATVLKPEAHEDNIDCWIAVRSAVDNLQDQMHDSFYIARSARVTVRLVIEVEKQL